MSDKLKQVGKTIGKSKKQTDFLLTRVGQRFPLIERIKDVFDGAFPFLMEFVTEVDDNNVVLDLYFTPYYNYTNLCESFNATSQSIQLLYAYITGSTVLKFNGSLLVRGTSTADDYYESDATLGEVTLGSSYFTGQSVDTLIACYTINATLSVPPATTFYPSGVKVWLNNTDITYWVFGTETLNPNNNTNVWRSTDISNYIKGAGRHKLKLTTTSSGKVEVRLKIR